MQEKFDLLKDLDDGKTEGAKEKANSKRIEAGLKRMMP
mgnify:CR=1 FL=1